MRSEAPVPLDTIVENIAESITVIDLEGRIVYANPAAARHIGYESVEELLATPMADIFARFEIYDLEGKPLELDRMAGRRALKGEDEPETVIGFREKKTGMERWSAVKARPLTLNDGKASHAVVVFRDITSQVTQEKDAQRRAAQQAAVARLGLDALRTNDLQGFLDHVVRETASVLDVELCKVLELRREGDLRLAAGVGWREGLVGHGRVGGGLDSQAGYTLSQREPVIVRDLRTETRFSGPPLLFDHEVVSGISAVIGNPEDPYGVLGAHTRKRRDFTTDDANFLQSVANILAEAVDAWRHKDELRLRTTLLDAVGQAVIATDIRGHVIYWNKAAEEMTGWPEREALGRSVADLAPNVIQQSGDPATIREDILRGGSWSGEFELQRKDGISFPALVKIAAFNTEAGDIRGLLAVAVDITSRRWAERRLAAQYEVSTILAEAEDLVAAAPRVLRVLCEKLDWDIGDLWAVDASRTVMTCQTVEKRIAADAFEAATKALALERGQGLAGAVWAASKPVWVADLTNETTFIRRDAAVQDGLRTGVAVPIQIGPEVFAMIELFTREACDYDADLLTTLATIGSQMGHFVEGKRAEAALRESEERYRNLVELSPAPILVHQDAVVVYANPSAAELLSADEPQEIIGRSILALVHPDYHDLIRERIRRVVEERLHAELVEERFIRLDGRTIDVEVVSIPVDFNGRPASHVVMRDVTERKRAEAALRDAEARYRGIFENAVLGIFQTSRDGRFIAANEYLAQILGFDSAEQLKSEVTDIGHQVHVNPATREEFVRRLEAEGVVTAFEAKAYRRDGSIIDISLTGRLVREEDGTIAGYEGMVEDITARKSAEERLREQTQIREVIEEVASSVASELQFDKAAQAVTDAATILTGAQFGAFFYNQTDERGEYFTLYNISGVPKESFKDFPMPRNTLLFGPTFRGEDVIRIDDVPKDPRYGKSAPYFGMPEGHLPVRSYLAVPVVARSGEVMGGLFFGHEEPGRFQERQEALARGIARWAGIAVDNARLYTQSQEVQEELRKLNEAKDEFLGMVSHELRTPITTIYGGARLMQARRSALDEERQGEILADIEQESERMFRLVEDMLALARMELGERVALKPTDLTSLVDRVATGFLRRRPTRKVVIDIPSDIGDLMAETTYLEQTLRNLLSNADKYSPADQPIRIEAERTGPSEVTVSVLDRGQGLTPEEMEVIFERFYRSPGTARQAAGLGIGLTVCKRLVEAQGGRIWADHREGGGLSMRFALAAVSAGAHDGV